MSQDKDNVIKVMLCDDIKSVRDYFQKTIDAQSDMRVIRAVASGEEAISCLADGGELPDIILMDIQMEDEKAGICATQRIHGQYPGIRILMLTIHANDDLLIEAYLAGAVDYIVKDVEPEVVCTTLRNAKENEHFIGSIIREKTREKLNKNRTIEISLVFFMNKMSKLTNSEWRILRQLYEGRKRREIAKAEVLSEETVKLHVRHILRKLGFATSREMVDYLKKLNIMDYFDWEAIQGE